MKQPPNPTIKFNPIFSQQLANAPREVKIAFLDVLQLFTSDPHHESLRNHQLKDRYAGFRSIDVTPDWRAVFKETTTAEGKTTITSFRLLGTHEQLYG